MSQLCSTLRLHEQVPHMPIALVVSHTLKDISGLPGHCCTHSIIGCLSSQDQTELEGEGDDGGMNPDGIQPECPSCPCFSLLCPLFADRDMDYKLLVESSPVDFDCCVVLGCLIGSPGLDHRQSRGTKAAS